LFVENWCLLPIDVAIVAHFQKMSIGLAKIATRMNILANALSQRMHGRATGGLPARGYVAP
jgi:hypothetical protein